VGKSAGIGVSGSSEQAGKGDVQRGEERGRLSPSPTPLNSSTSHCLFTAFLVHFAGGGEGTGRDSGDSGSGNGGSGGEGLGLVNGRGAKTSRRGA
jgi:hypothetical protein